MFKSFAGIASCVDNRCECVFTWHRKIDYRPEGPPDVGKMVFLDPEHEFLQEDGVLPGDDYREIWKRVDGNAHNSFGGRCFLPDAPRAVGFFVVSGTHVAVATRQTSTYADDDGCSLKSIFVESGRCPSASEQDALDKYFSVVACNGIVICCSRPLWMGKSFEQTISECIPECKHLPPHPIANSASFPISLCRLNSVRELPSRRERIYSAASYLRNESGLGKGTVGLRGDIC